MMVLDEMPGDQWSSLCSFWDQDSHFSSKTQKTFQESSSGDHECLKNLPSNVQIFSLDHIGEPINACIPKKVIFLSLFFF